MCTTTVLQWLVLGINISDRAYVCKSYVVEWEQRDAERIFNLMFVVRVFMLSLLIELPSTFISIRSPWGHV